MSTKIQWCDETWNPVRGCTKVSPGCKNCYAETFAERWRGIKGHPFEQGFDLRLVPEALELPLKWRKPRRVFVNSMSDLFHEGVPDEFLDRVFAVMALAPQHRFQILTKRPQRMMEYLTRWPEGSGRVNWVFAAAWKLLRGERTSWSADDPEFAKAQAACNVERWPLPNVWLGVSVENQAMADERIPILLQTPAAVRFLSVEPLLERIDLTQRYVVDPPDFPTERLANCEIPRIDWVIVGGESGPGARPCNIEWIREIVHQCKAAGVACFVKQIGAKPLYDDRRDEARLCWPKDRKGGDMAEWPEDLRVREFPLR